MARITLKMVFERNQEARIRAEEFIPSTLQPNRGYLPPPEVPLISSRKWQDIARDMNRRHLRHCVAAITGVADPEGDIEWDPYKLKSSSGF